jgi:hypothetical protein
MAIWRLFGILAALLLLTGWGWHRDHHALEWPHVGPMPDDAVKVKPFSYAPITAGNRSYRPVDPMPWGDVNRRVAPRGSLPGAPPASKRQGNPAPEAPKQ